MDVGTHTHESSHQIHGHHRPGGDAPEWDKRGEVLARILKQGGRALIVGGKIEMWPPEFRNDPRLEFWCNTESDQVWMKKEVPANVRVIISTRWVRHFLTAKLIEATRSRHLQYFPLLGPGEIKRLLAAVVQIDTPPTMDEVAQPVVTGEIVTTTVNGQAPTLVSAPADAEEPMPKKDKLAKGWLTGLIAEHVDLNARPTAESQRLYALFTKKGYKTTVGSVMTAIGTYRKKQAGGGVTSPRAPKATAVPSVASGKKTTGKGRKAAATAPGDERLVSDIAEARRMVTELGSTVQTAVSIVAELLDKLQAEIKARRERLERMRQLAAEEF